MGKDWYQFQEKIKDHFKKLGCDAKTNVRIKGTRTNHDIDVLIKSKFLGHNITWGIEAKKWKEKVSKLHVLALRQIVDDTGMDKAFIISENGFQSGAIDASAHSNIELLTFEQLKNISEDYFHSDILNQYLDRINLNINRYYSHSKKIRIQYGLRQEPIIFDGKFDVYIIMIAIIRGIKAGISGDYPIDLNTHLNEQYGTRYAENFYQLINWLNQNLITIEESILKAEIEMQKNDDFKPSLSFKNKEENLHMILFKGIK